MRNFSIVESEHLVCYSLCDAFEGSCILIYIFTNCLIWDILSWLARKANLICISEKAFQWNITCVLNIVSFSSYRTLGSTRQFNQRSCDKSAWIINPNLLIKLEQNSMKALLVFALDFIDDSSSLPPFLP